MQKHSISTRGGKGEEKNYLNLPLRRYVYCRERDLFTLVKRSIITRLLLPNALTNLSFLHYAIGAKRNFVAVHLFNRISLGKTPWIVTFESRLPRLGYKSGYQNTFALHNQLKLLQRKSCKKILAMSNCAYNLQLCFLDKYPDLKDDILNKMQVFHPPQTTLISDYSEKLVSDQCVTFTVVGNEFFRKGGLPIAQAFDQLLQEKHPVDLSVISTLSTHASGATTDDVNYAQNLFKKYPDFMHHFSSISNEEVMKILQRTHVALLPSLDETYGYSVLEAQANGCPVISTNVRAFLEINNDEIGWIIKVPLDEALYCAKGFRNWAKGNVDGSIKNAESLIREELVRIIHEIVDSHECLRRKGTSALERIRKFHDPRSKAEELEHIYDEAISA